MRNAQAINPHVSEKARPMEIFTPFANTVMGIADVGSTGGQVRNLAN